MSKTTTESVTETVEKEVENIATDIQEGKVDTLDSNARYLGYFARAQRYIVQGSRYVAYTSDIGEAFRPVVPPSIVTAGYAVSWMYLIGDVGYEGYKAKFVRNEGIPSSFCRCRTLKYGRQHPRRPPHDEESNFSRYRVNGSPVRPARRFDNETPLMNEQRLHNPFHRQIFFKVHLPQHEESQGSRLGAYL